MDILKKVHKLLKDWRWSLPLPPVYVDEPKLRAKLLERMHSEFDLEKHLEIMPKNSRIRDVERPVKWAELTRDQKTAHLAETMTDLLSRAGSYAEGISAQNKPEQDKPIPTANPGTVEVIKVVRGKRLEVTQTPHPSFR